MVVGRRGKEDLEVDLDPCASPRIRARISAFGELMSSQIGLLAIRAAGIPCVRLDARRLLHSTETALQQDEDRYLESNVDPISNPTLFKNDVRLIELKIHRLLFQSEILASICISWATVLFL